MRYLVGSKAKRISVGPQAAGAGSSHTGPPQQGTDAKVPPQLGKPENALAIWDISNVKISYQASVFFLFITFCASLFFIGWLIENSWPLWGVLLLVLGISIAFISVFYLDKMRKHFRDKLICWDDQALWVQKDGQIEWRWAWSEYAEMSRKGKGWWQGPRLNLTNVNGESVSLPIRWISNGTGSRQEVLFHKELARRASSVDVSKQKIVVVMSCILGVVFAGLGVWIYEHFGVRRLDNALIEFLAVFCFAVGVSMVVGILMQWRLGLHENLGAEPIWRTKNNFGELLMSADGIVIPSKLTKFKYSPPKWFARRKFAYLEPLLAVVIIGVWFAFAFTDTKNFPMEYVPITVGLFIGYAVVLSRRMREQNGDVIVFNKEETWIDRDGQRMDAALPMVPVQYFSRAQGEVQEMALVLRVKGREFRYNVWFLERIDQEDERQLLETSQTSAESPA